MPDPADDNDARDAARLEATHDDACGLFRGSACDCVPELRLPAVLEKFRDKNHLATLRRRA